MPIGIWYRLNHVAGSSLCEIVGGDDAKLIRVGLGRRRQPLADLLDIAHGNEEAIGLIKERVLLDFGTLVG